MSQLQTAGSGQRPLYKKLARRLATAIAIVALCLIPSLVFYAITGEVAATWATVAGIAGVAAVVSGGRQVAILSSLIMALITPLAIVAGSVPIAGAALMALMCLMVGHMSRFGLNRATLLVPVFMAWMIIQPPVWGAQKILDRTDGTYLAWMTLFFLIGALVPVLVLSLIMRKIQLPTPPAVTHASREAIQYTVTITVLTTAATFWVLDHPKQVAGAWVISTILVLAQVGEVGTLRRTVPRVVGTLLGMIIVGVIVLEVNSMVVLYVIGLVFGVAAITAKFSPHYWIYMTLITPAVVCLGASSSSQLGSLGTQRLVDTLAGAGLVLIAAGLTIGYSRVTQRLEGTPTDAATDVKV
jgi:hypothetical protein